MLGVAFNLAQRQKFYDRFRVREHWVTNRWVNKTVKKVKFVSEELN